MNPVAPQNPPAGPETLFRDAKDSFLLGLTQQEQTQFSTCSSPEELINSLGPFTLRFEKGRRNRIIQSIKIFTENLQPYFEVLNIFISSHPDWAAIAWGAFRLVLQLASNFTSFFEKLVDLLDQVRAALPRFSDLLELTDTEPTPRLRLSIQGFYIDLFHLFQAVVQVFTKRSGKVKRTPHIIAQLFWQPFEVKFKSIENRLEMHKRVISEEIDVFQTSKLIEIRRHQLDQLQQSRTNGNDINNFFKAQQKLIADLDVNIKKVQTAKATEDAKLHSSKSEHIKEIQAIYRALSIAEFDTKCRDITRFINPPEFVDELERAQEAHHEGTGLWMFNDSSFIEWTKPGGENAFWINGNPGCGKTVLAGLAVSEIPRHVKQDNIILAYFFFNQRTPMKSLKDNAYRSIIAQIFQKASGNETFLNALTYTMQGQAQLMASTNILKDIIRIAANCIKNIFIVLDGVDECENADQFISEFLGLLHNTTVKILIFSRPNINHLRQVKEHCRISITQALNRSDLDLYCSTGVSQMISKKLLPLDIPDVAELADLLATGADGMFLWAKLMFSYLESPALAPPHRAPGVRLQAIRQFRYPDNLDRMYCRILQLIWSFESYGRELARQVFLWLLFPKSYIGAGQLHDVLDSSYDHKSEPDSTVSKRQVIHEVFAAFDNDIIVVCSSLVELVENSKTLGPYYRFIHQSAIDFLLTRIQSPMLEGVETAALRYFSICKPEAEIELTEACLDYLKFRVPAGPLSGSILQTPNRLEVEQAFPFLPYASRYWSSHLKSSSFICKHHEYSGNLEKMMRSLTKFLSLKVTLMSWVESAYLFGDGVHWHRGNIVGWVEWATEHNFERIYDSPSLPREISSFMDDLVNMDELWGITLRSTPEQIWQDITAFTPIRFFLQTSATTVEQLVPENPQLQALSKVCLCTISSDKASEKELGVLGIWPSKSFEETWNRVHSQDDITSLYQACRGWAARYQIWDISTDEPMVKSEYMIPLDEKEVWLQVQHFLMRSQPREFWHTKSKTKSSINSGRLVLQFPTEISRNDVNTFVILRTVYTVIRESPFSSANQMPQWTSSVTPLEFNDALKSIWSEEIGLKPMTKSPVKYTYKFEFSECGRYLLYHDTTSMPVLPKLSKVATTIAVFQTHTSIPMMSHLPGVNLLGHIERSTPSHYFAGWTFHPTLPILAIQACSMTEMPRLMLWNFCLRDIENSLEDFGIMKEVAEEINFTECGTSLLIKYSSSSCPQKRTVGKTILYRDAIKAFHPVDKLEVSEEIIVSTQHIGVISMQQVGSLNSGHMQLGQNSQGDTTFQRLDISRNGPAGVDLVEVDGNVEYRQPILSLPKSEANEHLRVSIQPSTSRDEKITIILHKAAQPWYSLSNRGGEDFPRIVKKDRRAIRPAKKRMLSDVPTAELENEPAKQRKLEN